MPIKRDRIYDMDLPTELVGKTLSSAVLTGAVIQTATLQGASFIGTPIEDIYAIVDAAGVEIDPANGSIQTWTLGASRTPLATNFQNGQAITLMILDGAAYSIVWTTVAVTWVEGSAPTLNTSLYTVVALWKVGGTIYGKLVGAV